MMTHKHWGQLLCAALLLLLGACQKAPQITMTTPTTIDLSDDGSSGTITFTANRDWIISWSESWVHVSPAYGPMSKDPVSVTVRCDANTTYDDRTATVTIKAEDAVQTVTVRQPQNLGLLVEKTEYEVSPDGGTLEIALKTNVEFEVTPNVAWIHYIQTKALSNKTIVLTVDKNSIKARNGEVKISQKSGSLNVTVTVSQEGGVVDLGLSVKWRAWNLGATKPEEYGDYYAWGETSPKDNYKWETYEFRTSGDSQETVKVSKYNTKESYGPIDNKTILDPEDDAAHVVLGGKWRMPTDEEWTELRTQCVWTWTKLNGVNGYIVESKSNGNSIFLPAAGYRSYTSLYYAGSTCYYWSSSLDSDYPYKAWNMGFDSDGVYLFGVSRCHGQTVRPVTE